MMPEFGNPFSGLAKERKLTDGELVRAIRFMISAEYEAIQLYLQLAESVDNQLAIDVYIASPLHLSSPEMHWSQPCRAAPTNLSPFVSRSYLTHLLF